MISKGGPQVTLFMMRVMTACVFLTPVDGGTALILLVKIFLASFRAIVGKELERIKDIGCFFLDATDINFYFGLRSFFTRLVKNDLA